ncbi:hypothetical protein ACJX0J_041398, partial [Zea mays]
PYIYSVCAIQLNLLVVQNHFESSRDLFFTCLVWLNNTRKLTEQVSLLHYTELQEGNAHITLTVAQAALCYLYCLLMETATRLQAFFVFQSERAFSQGLILSAQIRLQHHANVSVKKGSVQDLFWTHQPVDLKHEIIKPTADSAVMPKTHQCSILCWWYCPEGLLATTTSH